ncbi:MAG: signal peptidase I [Candidatus Omnitrophica bacterium]|nr:signal peptidase I [Candidatus Omnitrophota bacterium]
MMTSKPPVPKSAAREWVESIIVALLLALFIREFFIQAFKIPSGSMIPTLLVGDRLMVNKLRYGPKVRFTDKRLPGFSKAKRGDIIVFIFPDDPKRDFIKRLIAFGGETVEIKDGDIYINGKHVEDLPIDKIYYYNRGQYGEEGHPVTVPKGYVYVLGDNSASSHDSRFWGVVPDANIIGRAEFIYWPLTRLRFLDEAPGDQNGRKK